MSRGAEWLLFFLGSPRRALATLVGLILLGAVHWLWPGAIGRLLAGAIAELWPVLCSLFIVAIVIAAIQAMLRPRR